MTASLISFLNFKGGVGKTAISVNVSTALSFTLGYKVLLIDLDPQSNTSIFTLGPKRWRECNENPTKCIYGVLKNQNPVGPCIVKDTIVSKNGTVRVPKLHLIPSCYKLMDIERTVSSDPANPYFLLFWKQLISLLDQYDFIIMDCPPNLYSTSECALFSSDTVIVPCNCDTLSIVGLSLLGEKMLNFTQTTEELHYQHRNGFTLPSISGIVLNNCPTQDSENRRKVIRNLRAKLADLKANSEASPNAKVFDTKIRQVAAFRNSSLDYCPVIFAKQKHKELIKDYSLLARKIVELTGK